VSVMEFAEWIFFTAVRVVFVQDRERESKRKSRKGQSCVPKWHLLRQKNKLSARIRAKTCERTTETTNYLCSLVDSYSSHP
jgi:hypothetical protein